MDPLVLLLVAVGLAMDVFAVSLGVGTTGLAASVRPVFRLSFHFGLFQALMTLLGWLAGSAVEPLIVGVDHWVAFGLLAFVGLRMIRSGLSGEDGVPRGDPSRGGTLVLLSLATSLDALAVGLSLAVLRVDILLAALVIGLVSAGLGVTGVLIGNRISQRFGKRMEILGGLLLVGIGARLLLAHLA
jgi:putative Mn2+ efflux pump MntP